MIHKMRSMTFAAILIVVIGGGQLVLANGVPPRALQTNPTTTISERMSRPQNIGVLNPYVDVIGLPLSQNECTGLGGVVADIVTSKCASGHKCVVANSDGSIHSACISVAK